MTPEDIIRTRVYEPPAEELPPHGEPKPDYGRLERNLARAFLALACFLAGLGIGLALP